MNEHIGWVLFVTTLVLWIVGAGAIFYARRAAPTDRVAEILRWGRIFVGAAEQLYTSNPDKFEFAYGQLRRKAAEISGPFDDDDLRAVIEWAVHELKTSLQQPGRGGAPEP